MRARHKSIIQIIDKTHCNLPVDGQDKLPAYPVLFDSLSNQAGVGSIVLNEQN